MPNSEKLKVGLPKLKVARVVFARLPLLGKTKSRLSYVLGEETALAIYKSLLHKQNDYFLYFEREKIKGKNFIYLHPESMRLWQAKKLLKPYFSFSHSYVYQRGYSLGEKLLHCVEETLAKYDRVVIWGSDIPTLEERHLREAWEVHPKNYIVPTYDGGYALVALSRENFHKKIFDNILWGSRKVFEQQIKNFGRLGLVFEVGKKVLDIDYPEDILRYISCGFAKPHDLWWAFFVKEINFPPFDLQNPDENP